MVNLTISLSEETIKRLRKTVHDIYGNKKGALSGLIEESLRERLNDFEALQTAQTFRALRGERLVAEAENLETLASKLAELKVDPRSVRIVSSKKLAPIVKTGLRGRRS